MWDIYCLYDYNFLERWSNLQTESHSNQKYILKIDLKNMFTYSGKLK